MKTAKEFIEKLQSNEDLAAQIREKAAAAEDKFAAVSAAAKELGYEVSAEELKAIGTESEDISEEELGKVAGGTFDIIATIIRMIYE